MLSTKERQRLLTVCAEHGKRFDAVAADFDRRAGLSPRPAPSATPEPPRLPRPELALTGREVEVLTLISSGFTNAEIGRRLFVGEETIKTHAQKILMKLEARNRAHAAALAVKRGLVELVLN